MLGNPHVAWLYGEFDADIQFSAILPTITPARSAELKFRKSEGGGEVEKEGYLYIYFLYISIT